MCRSALRVLFPILFLTLAGCRLNLEARPSILVIAVENLGFEDLPCGSDSLSSQEWSGFKNICEESVRFTHAYTPSLMTNGVLASLLTGLYPIDHGVRTNGVDFLSAKYFTVAEAANSKAYRTAFFSGGPPVTRRSGLAQGFELFEDNFPVARTKPFRSDTETIALWARWLRKEVGHQSFLSFLYLADLQLPAVVGSSDVGDSGSTLNERMMLRLSEDLSRVFKILQEEKRWPSTQLILLGTKGHVQRPRDQDPEMISLASENTQVPLLIKPARRVRDSGLEWKIDKNVSLVDVGRTLYDLLEVEVPKTGKPNRDVVSLKPALIEPSAPWSAERMIVSETAWPLWKENGGIRYAMRRDQYLFVYDRQPLLYNTQADRLEVSPLSAKDPIFRSVIYQFQEAAKNWGLGPFLPLKIQISDRLVLTSQIWKGRLLVPETRRMLTEFGRRWPKDQDVRAWSAALALEVEDWKWLEQLGRHYRKVSWIFVSKRNQGRKVRWRPRGCYRLLATSRSRLIDEDFAACEDSTFVSLVKWLKDEDPTERSYDFAQFRSAYDYQLLDREIRRLNLASGGTWDVVSNSANEPSLTDLYLALPQNRKARQFIQAVLSRKND